MPAQAVCFASLSNQAEFMVGSPVLAPGTEIAYGLHSVMASVLHGTLDDDLNQHYRHGALLETILTALRNAGQDPDHLSADDISLVDAVPHRRAHTRQ